MIREIHITNFKSIDHLELSLGRTNVFIGENGCGKTNILEAICFGAAAATNKLDNEFLGSRGIRYSEPRLMRAGFSKVALDQAIELKFVNEQGTICNPIIQNENKPYSRWLYTDIGISALVSETAHAEGRKKIGPNIERFDSIKDVLGGKEKVKSLVEAAVDEAVKTVIRKETYKQLSTRFSGLMNFLIFCPDPTAIRRLEEEERILPLGIRGEGLFRLLQNFSAEELQQIKEQLRMIDWFEDFQVPESGLPGERSLRIKDQYIADGIEFFDQRSSNEGFLFLLFYVCLLVSKHTPPFFAIDNIDNGLNPKLCMHLTSVIASLAAKHDKQVILTTHNPAVLDGLDLKDDEQRLFVVYRNLEGATRVRRVVPEDLPKGEDRVRLSEAFLRGYIGGLPKNF